MASQSNSGFHQHDAWTMPMAGARRAAFERFQAPRRWPWWMLDAARTREQPGTPEHIDALAEISLPDHDGNAVRLRDLWRDGPAVIVWLRQFGCPFCRAHAVQLNRARRRFADAGVQLVLIGQGTPADAMRFRRHLRIDLPVLTDVDRVTYLWASTKLATLDELIGPVVVVRGLLAMARQEVLIGHNTADEAQLGGSIVVLPDGTIPFSHISRNASDMASPKELLSAVGDMGRRSRPAAIGGAAPSQGRRAGTKASTLAMVMLLGSLAVRAPGVNAATSSGLPQSDPGQPVFVTSAGAAPLPTDRTVAHWHGQFTDPVDGTTYGFNMVGADPALQRDVTIQVDLIPINAVFPDQGNFQLNGSDIIARLLASPIFSSADYSSTPRVTGPMDASQNVSVLPGGPLSAGNTGVQLEDAIMRSQFNRVGTSYHLRLHPTVLSTWTLNCSRGAGGAFQNARGVAYGYCDNYSFDPPWGQWNPDPTHLVLFVGDNLIIGRPGGGALGWHAASRL
ncbi:MAG TPA: peroxiredoxin-like family protein, partial [Candidatus Acidoferrales bacterium]|nr:peroxiredoxin-like family protein [Candidatus Acidoferrales bacterium]